MKKEKLAIIGSGISGLSAAYFLSKKFDVYLYEKNSRLGGHTRTININEDNLEIPIDTGFIVYNNINYPDLANFFHLLNVKVDNSNMSFSVSNKNPKIEYSGKNIISLFSNTSNLISYNYLKMLFEIYHLYKFCRNINLDNQYKNMTLLKFLKQHNFSNYLIKYHIYPMISSIWSTNKLDLENFPLVFFINFFKNHGLFNLTNRPQWKYVLGGSNQYIKKILSLNLFKFNTSSKIKLVERNENEIKIIFSNESIKKFDKIVIATHADEALNIITNTSKKEKEILSSFKYSQNSAYLHNDESLMPTSKLAWSSWNFIQNTKFNGRFALTYWMNLLQNLPSKKKYFVSINPPHTPINIIDETIFKHPIFSINTLKAQTSFSSIQGNLNTYYCGSYWGYGFHEDGIQSSAYIAKLLNIELPWLRDENFYNRLQIKI